MVYHRAEMSVRRAENLNPAKQERQEQQDVQPAPKGRAGHHQQSAMTQENTVSKKHYKDDVGTDRRFSAGNKYSDGNKHSANSSGIDPHSKIPPSRIQTPSGWQGHSRPKEVANRRGNGHDKGRKDTVSCRNDRGRHSSNSRPKSKQHGNQGREIVGQRGSQSAQQGQANGVMWRVETDETIVKPRPGDQHKTEHRRGREKSAPTSNSSYLHAGSCGDADGKVARYPNRPDEGEVNSARRRDEEVQTSSLALERAKLKGVKGSQEHKKLGHAVVVPELADDDSGMDSFLLAEEMAGHASVGERTIHAALDAHHQRRKGTDIKHEQQGATVQNRCPEESGSRRWDSERREHSSGRLPKQWQEAEPGKRLSIDEQCRLADLAFTADSAREMDTLDQVCFDEAKLMESIDRLDRMLGKHIAESVESESGGKTSNWAWDIGRDDVAHFNYRQDIAEAGWGLVDVAETQVSKPVLNHSHVSSDDAESCYEWHESMNVDSGRQTKAADADTESRNHSDKGHTSQAGVAEKARTKRPHKDVLPAKPRKPCTGSQPRMNSNRVRTGGVGKTNRS